MVYRKCQHINIHLKIKVSMVISFLVRPKKLNQFCRNLVLRKNILLLKSINYIYFPIRKDAEVESQSLFSTITISIKKHNKIRL